MYQIITELLHSKKQTSHHFIALNTLSLILLSDSQSWSDASSTALGQFCKEDNNISAMSLASGVFDLRCAAIIRCQVIAMATISPFSPYEQQIRVFQPWNIRTLPCEMRPTSFLITS